MEQRIVRELETNIEAAVADVMRRQGSGDLPLRPSRRTLHLMAKAAVTVYETAVENARSSEAP